MQGIKFVPTEEQIATIKELYNSPDITQKEIADLLGVNPYTLNRIAKDLGLVKTRKNVWTSEKIAWLKKNYNLTYREMVEHLQFDNETIRLKINELGLKRTTVYRPFKLDMEDQEFLSDLDNPTLTASDIVEKYKDKYGVGESRIHQLRKQRKIKLQVNTIDRSSTAEIKVRSILEEIDVAYVQEKKIGKYSIDFYLGFKLCLEVQGRYWHSQSRRIESDHRKKQFLESKGYKVIYVWDDELHLAKGIITEALQNLGLPV